MGLRLVRDRVRQTIDKNRATSYGLTLVVGLPFSTGISVRIQRLQHELEGLLPGCFTWYGTDHLHATLIAPLRGRYRERPPLQRDELPQDLHGLVCDLAALFSRCPPFCLELAGVHLTSDGLVRVREETLLQRLSVQLLKHPELDQPKRLDGLHATIGYLDTTHVFDTGGARQQIEKTLCPFRSATVGSMTVQRVWLVHYARRTLGQIVGKVPFALGQPNAIDARDLLDRLGIA
jgi:hypothetical protein